MGKRTAGAYVICDFIWNIGIAILPLSFADYLQSLIPGIPIKATALVVLTLFFVINLFGVKQAALIETIMLVVMGLALGSFVVFGMPQVQPGAFGGVSAQWACGHYQRGCIPHIRHVRQLRCHLL